MLVIPSSWQHTNCRLRQGLSAEESNRLMKKDEMRDLTPDELKDKLGDLRKQLMELTFQKKTTRVEKPHRFRYVKKDIARILTILKEKSDG